MISLYILITGLLGVFTKDCDLPLAILDSSTLKAIPDGCTTLNGHVLLSGPTSPTQDQLTQKFSQVTKVSNGLVVITETPFTSVSFFQNLQTIDYPNSDMPFILAIAANSAMTTLNLPNLTSVSAGTNYSATILSNPNLCLSRTEITNLINMNNAVFLMNQVCGDGGCAELTSGIFDSTDNIPAGCQYMNAALELTQINDPSKLENLKEVYGPIIIKNTTITSLNMNLQFIYNQLPSVAAMTIAYNQLQSFTTPYLSKVKSSYKDAQNIIVTQNPNLQMTLGTCSIWANVSSYITVQNKLNCENATGSGPPDSASTNHNFCVLFVCQLLLFFLYH